MKRILEKEVMDEPEQAAAYCEANFSESNKHYIRLLIDRLPSSSTRILDIGCGPGWVPISLAKLNPKLTITAIDASSPMLVLAKKNILKFGCQEQIHVLNRKLPNIDLPNYDYDVVISKDTLHQLHQPLIYWEELIRIRSLASNEIQVFLTDLYRPDSAESARNIVETVAGEESELLKEDFYNSLLAAFTIDEIRDQLNHYDLDLNIEKISDRHLMVHGKIK